MVIAKGSLVECVAILDLMHSEKIIDKEQFKKFYYKAEEISKMLYAMIRNHESKLKKK
jgi:four helix bundle protein